MYTQGAKSCRKEGDENRSEGTFLHNGSFLESRYGEQLWWEEHYEGRADTTTYSFRILCGPVETVKLSI